MITIKNTENFTGVTISGDFDDLYNLVDAIHEITVDEYSEKNQDYLEISTRVLGFCYDIRHSYQGDREIELVDNNLNVDKMKLHSLIATKSNVYYKNNYLYPEMFFVMLAMNELLDLRMQQLTKTRYPYIGNRYKSLFWDDKIAIIRLFQAQFAECVKGILTEVSFKKWLKFMNEDYLDVRFIAHQYIDFLNIKYINMTKEKRIKNLNTIAKRIAEYRYDKDHDEIKEVITEAAREHDCAPGDIRLQGIEYPDEVIW